jgi:hypothetical protein
MIIEILDKELNTCLFVPSDLQNYSFKKSLIETGEFTLSLPADYFDIASDWHLVNFSLEHTGKSVFLGIIEKYHIKKDEPRSPAIYEITGVDFIGILNDKIIYINPSQPIDKQDTDKLTIQKTSYENAIKDLVKQNSSKDVPLTKRASALTNLISVVSTENRGREIEITDIELGKKLLELLREQFTDDTYYFDIVFNDERKIVFDVFEKKDISEYTILSTDYNNIRSLDFEQTDTDTNTTVLIGSFDEQDDKTTQVGGKEYTDANIVNLIGREKEIYASVNVDENTTFDDLANTQIENEKTTSVFINNTLTIEPTNTYYKCFIDYNVGDIVKVKINDEIITKSFISAVEYKVDNQGTEIACSIGVNIDKNTKTLKQIIKRL